MRIEKFAVQIVEFVDDHQPGRVVCRFVDAEGHEHRLIDKVPIFSSESLDARSEYPQPGAVRCEVLEQWREGTGRELARISTARPDDVETEEGLSEFVVVSSQLFS